MITQFSINGTEWTPVTVAGKSGSCWLDEDGDGAKGSMDVRLFHGTSSVSATITASKRVYKPAGNNDVLVFSADSSEDIFYARCKNELDTAILSVDAV